MRFALGSSAALLSLASSSLAGLTVESGKLSIIDSASSVARKTHQFTSTSTSPLGLIDLNREDSVRLAFDLLDSDSREPYQPEQVVVLATPVLPQGQSPKPGQDWQGAVKVRKNGKAKFELELSHAPIPFLTLGSDHPISLSLLIGDKTHAPILLPLATVQLPASVALPFPYPPDSDLPRDWEVEKYAPQPEIHWTYRDKEKGVNSVLVLLGLVAVLAPWTVLFGLAKALKLSVPTPTGWTAAFLASVLSVEALIVTYWIGLKLIPTLPVFGVLLVATAWTGRRALGEVRGRRLAAEKVAGGKTE